MLTPVSRFATQALAECEAKRRIIEERTRFTPGVRRSILVRVAQAKREATRTARVTETAERAARGEAAHQQPR